MRAPAGIVLLLSLLACRGGEPAEDSSSAVATTTDEATVFDERVAVLLLADSTMIDSLRRARDAEEFHVIADDMMYYRAQAYTWLEQHGIALVEMEGRPPVSFVVDGHPAPFAFAAEHSLDLVILYQPGRAPIAIAPIDLPTQGAIYFTE